MTSTASVSKKEVDVSNAVTTICNGHNHNEEDDDDEPVVVAASTDDEKLQQVPNLARERYLDRFPFQEMELDSILTAAEAVSSTRRRRQQVLLLSDMVQHYDNVVSPDYIDLVKRVEETIVTTFVSQQVVQVALESVFLWGNQEEEETDQESMAIPKRLEAMATLLGRRGPKSLLSIVFQVAVQIDQRTLTTPTTTNHHNDKDGDDDDDDDDTGTLRNQSSQGYTNNTTNTASPITLVDLMHRWMVACGYLQDYHQNNKHDPRSSSSSLQPLPTTPPASWISSLTALCQKDNTNINNNLNNNRLTLSSWMDFCTWTAPQVAATLSSYCHLSWWGPNHPFRGSDNKIPFDLPYSHDPLQSSAIWKNDRCTSSSNEVAMSLSLIGLGGGWRRLYSTDWDGNHFNIFQQALQGYQGKTVLLIQTTSGAVFGYYTACPWKISQSWYGAQADAFLFRVSPQLNVYGRTTEEESPPPYAMYLNPTPVANRNRKAEEALSGLAIGGIADQIPRLHITKSFDNCRAHLMDRTYRPGPLLEDDSAIFFDIDVMELWAVQVDDDEFAAGCALGQKQLAVHEAYRNKAAKITDRSVFLSDFESDDCYMRAKVYAHRDEVRGRHEFVAHDGEGRGYFMEDHPPSVRTGLADGSGFFHEDGPYDTTAKTNQD